MCGVGASFMPVSACASILLLLSKSCVVLWTERWVGVDELSEKIGNRRERGERRPT